MPVPLPTLYANIAIKRDLVRNAHCVFNSGNEEPPRPFKNQPSSRAAAGQRAEGSHGSLRLVRVFPATSTSSLWSTSLQAVLFSHSSRHTAPFDLAVFCFDGLTFFFFFFFPPKVEDIKA